MFFSLIIPVYNVEKYLKECLDSVVNQTFKDYECILVDDGSKDSSASICDEYSIKYGFKVYHNENKGHIASRIFGLKKASGEYILNLDSDDKLELNALEVIYNKIQTFNVDCVFFGTKRFDEKNTDYYPYTFKEEKLYADKREFYLSVLGNPENNAIWRKAVKRSLVGSIDFSKFFHILVGEDALQSLEIYKNCSNILVIPDILHCYRINNQGIMKSLNIKKYDTDFTVEKEILKFLQEENIFSENDFKIYRSYCLLNLVRFLRGISDSNATNKEKKNYFKKVRKSTYYNDFIKGGKIIKKLIGAQYFGYFLFKIRAYSVFIFLQKTFNKIKSR